MKRMIESGRAARRPPCKTATGRGARGFTLVELVVVLGILAAVALVAVQNVARRQNALRGERSGRVLEDLRRGICGEAGGEEGAKCFVEDLGRLPRGVSTNLGGVEWVTLGELVERPEGVSAFQVVEARADTVCGAGKPFEAVADAGVKVAWGWNGPYALPPVGAGAPWFRDGWGHGFASRAGGGAANRISADGTFDDASEGMTVAFLRHLGADAEAEGSEWARGGADDGDAVVDLRWAVGATARCRASFSNATEVVFRLYLPCDCEGGDGSAKIHVRELSDALGSGGAEGENGFGAVFTGVPRGRWMFTAHPAGETGRVVRKWVRAE